MSSLITIAIRSTFGADGSIRTQELFDTCEPENIFEVVKAARAIFNMDTEPFGVHCRCLNLYRFLGVITMPRDEYVRNGLPTEFREEDMVAWYTLRLCEDGEYEAVMNETVEYETKTTKTKVVKSQKSKTSKPKSKVKATKSYSTENSKKTKFTYREMIADAIDALKERQGSSVTAIEKYILAQDRFQKSFPTYSHHYPRRQQVLFHRYVKHALAKGVEEGYFARAKNSYKLQK